MDTIVWGGIVSWFNDTIIWGQLAFDTVIWGN